eukprot:GHVS01107186.1.p1 GENE.GHVS01107186.1~~GHVS01107186.1.p1  ORF type:complete len:487 (+),score=46.80 GHVS01107186.1:142-1602(+)
MAPLVFAVLPLLLIQLAAVFVAAALPTVAQDAPAIAEALKLGELTSCFVHHAIKDKGVFGRPGVLERKLTYIGQDSKPGAVDSSNVLVTSIVGFGRGSPVEAAAVVFERVDKGQTKRIMTFKTKSEEYAIQFSVENCEGVKPLLANVKQIVGYESEAVLETLGIAKDLSEQLKAALAGNSSNIQAATGPNSDPLFLRYCKFLGKDEEYLVLAFYERGNAGGVIRYVGASEGRIHLEMQRKCIDIDVSEGTATWTANSLLEGGVLDGSDVPDDGVVRDDSGDLEDRVVDWTLYNALSPTLGERVANLFVRGVNDELTMGNSENRQSIRFFYGQNTVQLTGPNSTTEFNLSTANVELLLTHFLVISVVDEKTQTKQFVYFSKDMYNDYVEFTEWSANSSALDTFKHLRVPPHLDNYMYAQLSEKTSPSEFLNFGLDGSGRVTHYVFNKVTYNVNSFEWLSGQSSLEESVNLLRVSGEDGQFTIMFNRG